MRRVWTLSVNKKTARAALNRRLAQAVILAGNTDAGKPLSKQKQMFELVFSETGKILIIIPS
jgi:hypothetical protein